MVRHDLFRNGYHPILIFQGFPRAVVTRLPRCHHEKTPVGYHHKTPIYEYKVGVLSVQQFAFSASHKKGIRGSDAPNGAVGKADTPETLGLTASGFTLRCAQGPYDPLTPNG